MNGTFKRWLSPATVGLIEPSDTRGDVYFLRKAVPPGVLLSTGTRVTFDVVQTPRGRQALNLTLETGETRDRGPGFLEPVPREKQASRTVLAQAVNSEIRDPLMESEEIEDLNTEHVESNLLKELASWKREARSEDGDRYFWHVREVDEIDRGTKYYVIGRKGSGKTAISEYFNRQTRGDIFAEKLTFKNFPFNDLYRQHNQKYTAPNQFITIWKYLIYSTACRLMIKNEAVPAKVREQLAKLYGTETSLSRRVSEWVGRDFGVSLFGLSLTMKKRQQKEPTNWIDRVDFLEDLLLEYGGDATYFVLFDELDEDYRDIIEEEQSRQYTALITSLFKAVQDVRATFASAGKLRVFPVIFLRDDIYEIVQDSDKNKWGDFRVDLTWDTEKIKKLMAFRISRALDPTCTSVLSFETAWSRVFGKRNIGIGAKKKHRISTFDFIARSTLLRPRDFVTYLQSCAHYALEEGTRISPSVVRRVDKAFSNYLKDELTDELFAILPDIANIFDAISQLRKWNFSIPELERAYSAQIKRGFLKEENVKVVLQTLFLFSVIGNTPYTGRYVFRYQNREARLNFNERVIVHRGLFKALQII